MPLVKTKEQHAQELIEELVERELGDYSFEWKVEIEDADEEETIGFGMEEADSLLQTAIDLALSTGYISASMVQRRLRVGYNRAARMVEQMEARGIVGPAEGSKPRPIIANL